MSTTTMAFKSFLFNFMFLFCNGTRSKGVGRRKGLIRERKSADGTGRGGRVHDKHLLFRIFS